MSTRAHTSKDFEADLGAIRARVLEMGGIAEYQVRYAVEALKASDMALVDRVLHDEVRLNTFEREIDELCTHTVARRFPAAGDLRFVMAVLKTITDLERIGDEAKKIALTARRFHERGRLMRGGVELQVVAGIVVDMLRRAVDGLARLRDDDAANIARQDQLVDEHFRAILRQLLTYMIEDPRTISASIDLVFAAKALERVGDHAKNISEHVVYLIKGADVRHATVEEIEHVIRS